MLISTDIIGWYGGAADVLRKSILTECQLEPSQLFLSAIHTHSAPSLTYDPAKGHSNNFAYSKTLEQKLLHLVKNALSATQPVQMSFGSGASPVGASRRQITQDEHGNRKTVLGRNPTAPVDHEVQVLKLSMVGSQVPAAVLFSYPSHSTSLGPQNYIISGDVHGLAEQFVERYFGGQALTAGFAGTSGDIDPWYRTRPEFKTTNGWVPEPVLLGTLLGEEVAQVVEQNLKSASNCTVKTAFEAVELPGKPKTEGAPPGTATLNITVARVGSVAFVGLGGEVFNEIGQKIKKDSPFPCTFIMTHCNGAAGYLPTQPSYAEGGYEVQSSPFAPGAAELIPQHVARLLASLGADE